MSVSAISSGSLSYVSDLLSSSSASTPSFSSSSSTTDTFSSTLSELESAIKSVDLTSAKDPVGTFLTSVEKALSTEDISSAQTAHTTFQTAPTPGSPSSSSSTGGFGSELQGLESAIQSGDLTSAKSYLNEIEQSSPSQSTPTSSSTTSSSTSATDPIGTFLKIVEAAISSGSLSAAQTALSTFKSQPYPGST